LADTEIEMYGLAAVVLASLVVAAHNPPWGLVFFPIAILVGLFTAYPVLLFFVGLEKTKWWHAVLGGSLLASLAGVLDLIDREWSLWHVVAVAPWAASGALLGLLVWYIAIYINPAHGYRGGDAEFPWVSNWLWILLPCVYWYLFAVSGSVVSGCVLRTDTGVRPAESCRRYIGGIDEDNMPFSACWIFGAFDGSEVGSKVSLFRYRGPDLREIEHRVITFHTRQKCTGSESERLSN